MILHLLQVLRLLTDMRLDWMHMVVAVDIADTAVAAVLVTVDTIVAVAAVAAVVVAAAAFCSDQLCCSIDHYCYLQQMEIADHRHLLQHHCYPYSGNEHFRGSQISMR